MDSKVHELYVRQYGEPDGGRRIQVSSVFVALVCIALLDTWRG
jgi:hypothetical protein